MEQEQISDEELAFCEETLKAYTNKCECKNLDEVHWKLRCLLSVTCEMLESIEAGRTEEIKQH